MSASLENSMVSSKDQELNLDTSIEPKLSDSKLSKKQKIKLKKKSKDL